MEKLKSILKRHEGFRSEPYRDDRGNWTIGYGHYLGNGSCKISPQVADLILNEDIHTTTFEFLSLGCELDGIRKDVCIMMIFWHGFRGFLKFKKMIAALQDKDYKTAANEMMDSKSGRDYHTRMQELATLMRTG